ncbi:XRE family transcriptional regulator [Pseudoflavonifractor sp. 60]|jgi:transcriptional regulator with XRE-family HTH domain|uniref:helix-turn-helix domain-containing protein n=1 Tax=Pseudoflavonifractor sp. 60 TaxID=2304576 RepID=UPI00136826E9|nr:helix-turn-helix transcriptional regulator [Pseudoflavonifractor sp. 60]NBI67271.1 XRE family transcriptional regulator [Pseudoflavonifractor sp. 60]
MPNDVLVNGGARLRAIRKERGYTQEQLAELTKLSTRHIAGIEKGEANPSFEVLYTITTVLGVSFDVIFNPADEQVEREIQEITGLYRACPEQGRRLILASIRAMVHELTDCQEV